MTDKRLAEICLGSCGGCEYCNINNIFNSFCIKRKKKVWATDPACTDYKAWTFKGKKENDMEVVDETV